jgi:hypothetical protein
VNAVFADAFSYQALLTNAIRLTPAHWQNALAPARFGAGFAL